MAFGSLDDTQAAREPMADINTTPLVDVMLVLLVIFIITAPLFTHAVKLDLPDQPAATMQDRERPIVISIDAEGQVFWDDTKLTDAEFDARLSALAQAAKAGKTAPALHLRADKATRYERVAMVMAQAGAVVTGVDASQEMLAFVHADDPGNGVRRTGDIADDRHVVTDDDALPAEIACLHGIDAGAVDVECEPSPIDGRHHRNDGVVECRAVLRAWPRLAASGPDADVVLVELSAGTTHARPATSVRHM